MLTFIMFVVGIIAGVCMGYSFRDKISAIINKDGPGEERKKDGPGEER